MAIARLNSIQRNFEENFRTLNGVFGFNISYLSLNKYMEI